MRLYNDTTGRVIAEHALLKTSFVGRLIGAMGQTLPVGLAMGIAPCDWIHTYFVYGPLDLLYCDRVGRVLCVAEEFAPFRFGPRVPGAYTVWELRGGTLSQNAVALGDELVMIE